MNFTYGSAKQCASSTGTKCQRTLFLEPKIGRRMATTLTATTRHVDLMTFDLRFPGANRIRTCDPLRAKQMLSQLSYSPTRNTVLNDRGPGKI